MNNISNNCDSLPCRRFGRTEMNIPVLSLGGMRFQHSWSDLAMKEVTNDSQMNLEEILKFASKNGFHHIETARHYGTSELQLGSAMKRVVDSKRIVQTKIPPREDPNEFEKELELSYSKLQCKKIDLLAIHGLNLPEHLDQTIRPGGCLEVVRRWQRNDRIKHVGFSTHGPTDLIVKAIETNEFDYINLHWYFIFQDNEPALAAAAKFDLGVFIISPTDKGGHLHTPSAKLLKLCSPLHPIVFNDLFCLSDARVHTISVGASNIRDFLLHLHAVDTLDQAHHVLPGIKKRLLDAANSSLGEDWMATWREGLPVWDQTPGEINIPVLIWLYNLQISWGMEDYAKARYRLLGGGSHWFPGANCDNLDNTVSVDDLKEALQLSPWVDEIVERLRELREKFKGIPVQRLSDV
ncbi:Predicted oxidoreductase [Prochlorococcus marinus subsp. marinus str. CCMP1375]|uniref:Predicted oxidoreductase n=2 Tax=Prochlorococcaceae TaxID=2881426 RepID=Q7VA37_PROMA|nr:Predicted oxidoreductase [Prochlorococcus marinus subsp. marinus str. CCMP1375]